MWMVLFQVALAGKCKGLDDVVEALRVVEDEYVVELTATGVAEACSLVKGIDEALTSFSQVPPDYRRVIDSKAISEAPLTWNAACPGGLQAAAEVVTLPMDAHRPFLWEACELADDGVFTESEWNEATGFVFAPILVRQALIESKVPEDTARIIARGLAGYSLRVKPRVVDEFEPLF